MNVVVNVLLMWFSLHLCLGSYQNNTLLSLLNQSRSQSSQVKTRRSPATTTTMMEVNMRVKNMAGNKKLRYEICMYDP